MPGITRLQATAESTWTPEQALSWAAARKSWPTRRFRLEGSRAGNSRLLTQSAAEAARGQYGGTIVEIIPIKRTDTGLPRRTLNQARAAELGVACPKCGAADDRPCVAKNGEPRAPHLRRYKAAKARAVVACGHPLTTRHDTAARPCVREQGHSGPHRAAYVRATMLEVVAEGDSEAVAGAIHAIGEAMTQDG